MEKNMQKYNTYKSAIDQIKLAIDSGFFLEAITIEESIIVDRMFRFCKNNGMKQAVTRATLGDIVSCLKKLSEEIIQSERIDFIQDLDLFRENRNKCLHQIAKSEPGEPTMDFAIFIEAARITAQKGKELTKKVSAWSQKYKNKLAKNAK